MPTHQSKLTMSSIEGRIRDIYRSAEAFKWPQSEILERISKLYEELATRTPSGARRYSVYLAGFAQGYNRALSDALWQKLEFCYRDHSGVLYSTHPDSKHRKTEEWYKADRGAELGKLPGAHVWKGTDKPFAPFKVIGKEE